MRCIFLLALPYMYMISIDSMPIGAVHMVSRLHLFSVGSSSASSLSSFGQRFMRRAFEITASYSLQSVRVMQDAMQMRFGLAWSLVVAGGGQEARTRSKYQFTDKQLAYHFL